MLLLAAFTDPEKCGKGLEDYGKFIKYFKILRQSEADVILVHNVLCWTSGPVLGPKWYSQIALLKDYGKKFFLLWTEIIRFL